MPYKDPELRKAYDAAYAKRPEVMERSRELHRLWYAKNKARVLAKHKAFYGTPEYKAQHAKAFQNLKNNRPDQYKLVRARAEARRKERRRTDPVFLEKERELVRKRRADDPERTKQENARANAKRTPEQIQRSNDERRHRYAINHNGRADRYKNKRLLAYYPEELHSVVLVNAQIKRMISDENRK